MVDGADQEPVIGLVALRVQECQAWRVLRCHCDDKQGQGDADERGGREHGHREHRATQRERGRATSWNEPVAQVAMRPAASAARTAKRSKKRLPRKKVTTMHPAITGALANAPAAVTTKGSRMPASSAGTRGAGTLESSHPNQPWCSLRRPRRPMRQGTPRPPPRTRSHPGKRSAGRLPASTRPTMTGIRVNRLSTMLHTPLPMDSAHTQEAVCASSRPAARVASRTIRNGPAKLISADKDPATIAVTDTSRSTAVTRLMPAPPEPEQICQRESGECRKPDLPNRE